MQITVGLAGSIQTVSGLTSEEPSLPDGERWLLGDGDRVGLRTNKDTLDLMIRINPWLKNVCDAVMV